MLFIHNAVVLINKLVLHVLRVKSFIQHYCLDLKY